MINMISNRLKSLVKYVNVEDKVIDIGCDHALLDILNNKYLENINKLIIQSNKDYDLLRSEVIKLGFKILEEEVIVDNDKLYINIVFIRGNKEYTELELKYGTSTMINKEVYYKYLINKLDKIINSVSDDTLKDNLIKEKEIVNGLLD